MSLRILRRPFRVAALISLLFIPRIAQAQACAIFLAQSPPVTGGLVTPADLASVRDIVSTDSGLGAPGPLALSPDGRRLAFVLTRADPARNRYCRALMVLELASRGAPHIVDEGGEFLPMTQILRGLITRLDVAQVVTPHWSPDGRSIAFLRRDGGVTQAWVAAFDGSGARAVTASRVDIEKVDWAPNGRDLVIASRPALLDARAARAAEARQGFLYDDRYVPVFGKMPQLRGPLPVRFEVVGPQGRVRLASDAEAAILSPPDLGDGVLARLGGAGGLSAAVNAVIPGRLFSPATLSISDGYGRRATCKDCAGDQIMGLWWGQAPGSVLYLRREGWAGGDIALYSWRAGRSSRRLLRTPGLLTGCIQSPGRLYCLFETATRPRSIVAIDKRTGGLSRLFDPNPGFAKVRSGSVRRLMWTNAMGFRAFGDLVLPPDWRPGTRYPLIVVQYESRGFLRGGTGDEVPIFPLAASGYAVLSVQRPASYGSRYPGRFSSWREVDAIGAVNWAERRNVAGSVLAGIDAARALNVVDDRRIGLTGLSDGSTTAWYLLLHHNDLFAATAASTCCADPDTDAILVGPAWEAARERAGYPSPIVPRDTFWRAVSPALGASRITGPILLQLGDDEYQRALEAYAAFRRVGPPTEMHVFADEGHIKWQPAHRLALYQRTIDWFDFWLLRRRDPDPAKEEQYARWSALADQASARGWSDRLNQAHAQLSASARRTSSE
ncbi:Atxe2 family lasso peptide isopeptidase [Sphingomonas crocodyli]|uniref:Atxe2 family lasso peptide isopeptidase n=1 Tax=Sphingomonas crocodyli TaxID=1979270 RepID=A0A437LY31_9SPHN|nr:Atxe2 family lasso peptide isopeptidase [Sphingomonas crocodyli]RVT90329.1 Atxe2 family lasso peptide isopeptidase [Sphingomonas crocodyli]